ncbi:MAG: hypothetical protein G01um10147_1150 [Microgenomates group bacterium Gr01-1014_7]|nr:MAG: hypothetical protein G01um10147_1150 [Microgenomates group bacterium Gr01-1014_7]
MEAIGLTISTIVTNSLAKLGDYLPQFLAGLILLLIGLAVSAVLKEVVIRFLAFLRVEEWFGNVSDWFNKIKSDRAVRGKAWPGLVAEVVRWTVVILFLVPAAEAWGLPRVSELLNQFLLYIPNVFVAAVIAFIGLVIANLVNDVVKHASKSLGSSSANLLGTITRYAIVFFTVLIVLNQLGVAADLVRILFTGIVAMLAIAGGLAFGLGGQGTAKKVLDDLQKRVGK